MEKIKSNHNIMIKSDLEKLNQSELINLLLNQDKLLRQLLKEKQQKPKDAPRTMKSIAAPRKSVKQMVQSYQDNIILPPPEFSGGAKVQVTGHRLQVTGHRSQVTGHRSKMKHLEGMY